MNNRNKGFTLLELVIALAILGFMLAGLVGPMSTRFEQKERQATQEKLDNIKDALYGFVITNGRLPCPDTGGDGIEDACDTSAVPVRGAIPWTTLGVIGQDEWRNNFVYQVTREFADTVDGGACGAAPPPATVGVSFQLCSVGDITINDANGVSLVVNVPAIVYSGGKTVFASSTLEQENSDLDNLFINSDIRNVTNSEYDDMLIWVSPNILKNRMVQAGRLP